MQRANRQPSQQERRAPLVCRSPQTIKHPGYWSDGKFSLVEVSVPCRPALDPAPPGSDRPSTFYGHSDAICCSSTASR